MSAGRVVSGTSLPSQSTVPPPSPRAPPSTILGLMLSPLPSEALTLSPRAGLGPGSGAAVPGAWNQPITWGRCPSHSQPAQVGALGRGRKDRAQGLLYPNSQNLTSAGLTLQEKC